MKNIGQMEFATLIKKAEVRKIKFHGTRNTAATLALIAGINVKTVSYRLGPLQDVDHARRLQSRLARASTGRGQEDPIAAPWLGMVTRWSRNSQNGAETAIIGDTKSRVRC